MLLQIEGTVLPNNCYIENPEWANNAEVVLKAVEKLCECECIAGDISLSNWIVGWGAIANPQQLRCTKLNFIFTFSYPMTVVVGALQLTCQQSLHPVLSAPRLISLLICNLVHYVMMSSYLDFCLPLFLPLLIVPRSTVLASFSPLVMRLDHLSFHLSEKIFI
ncbi:hypothetical protein ElyMa_005769400 [Elysia marginata]|uniref:Uncharacterized protein n=1 Tax=Elysia marginata TaxID=1093978 RepID=A0AAV4FQS7_9GAST|nr:hypothetical protein ElyMa_005769400 [Elysia marginata]